MNERLTQALIRLAVSFVLAGIGAVIPLLTILNDAVDDKVMAAMVIAVATAVLQGAAKYIGGATEQTQAARGRELGTGQRPNALSV